MLKTCCNVRRNHNNRNNLKRLYQNVFCAVYTEYYPFVEGKPVFEVGQSDGKFYP